MYTYVCSGAALSGLAMSTLAIWSRVVQSRDVSPNNFEIVKIKVAPFLWPTVYSKIHAQITKKTITK